jgi:hypothetical protein
LLLIPYTMPTQRERRNCAAALLVLGAAVVALRAQAPESAATDALGRFGSRLASGAAKLDYVEGAGYLPSLLAQLGITIDSQVLVFSKTSFQHALINPKNPRALYFNDSVSIGMVPGGSVYEMMAVEPNRGLAFYTLDTKPAERPVFQRRGVECLFCHGPGNKGAAAMVVASVIPDAQGVPAYTSAFIDTIDHRTPFDRRWGGWYVTGTHGAQEHLGNAVARDPEHPLDLEHENTLNLTSLADRIDVTRYLAGSSDIVALMTLEHQVGATNRLGALGVQYRQAERIGAADPLALVDGSVRDLVDYLLFVGEAPLREPVKGVSAFTQTFAQRGEHDAQGRSLREFDLRTRLFRYRLSYMIYSDLFDGLPARTRNAVYRRLYDVLTGRDADEKYVSITADDRLAILNIVRGTKSNLPDYWSSAAGPVKSY